MVTLFSRQTRKALFTITASDETFKITPTTYGCQYELRADDEVIGLFKSPFAAVVAVAQHRTGWAPWDRSRERVSDYIKKWRCHVDDRFKVQLIADYLERGMPQSYRGMVDYFHFKHPYLMDRHEIIRLVEDLAVTGQVDVRLSESWIPSECRRVARLVKQWQSKDGV